MIATNWFLKFIIAVGVIELGACKKIKILSDFTNFEDLEFFKTTYPWIAKQVPELRVDYFFKDQDGGKRMCVLENLKHNLNLQSHYLSCEAESKEDCIKNMPLDQRRLEKCYRKSYSKLKAANKEFRKHGTNVTPLIVQGKSRQTVRDPMTVLLRICGMYGRKQPLGCRQPLKAPVPAERSTTPCTPAATEPAPSKNRSTEQNSTIKLSNRCVTIIGQNSSGCKMPLKLSQQSTKPRIPAKEPTKLTSQFEPKVFPESEAEYEPVPVEPGIELAQSFEETQLLKLNKTQSSVQAVVNCSDQSTKTSDYEYGEYEYDIYYDY